MPSNVAWFERLFYLSLLIGAPVAYLDFPRLARMGLTPDAMVAILGATSAIVALLVWLTGRRRKNWARWVLTIMTVLGIPMSVPNWLEMVQSSQLAAGLNALQNVMQVGALVLLFVGDAKDWFRPQAATP